MARKCREKCYYRLKQIRKVRAGIGDTTPQEVRLVGELVERVNTRFDSLQEQINIVKNKLEKRSEDMTWQDIIKISTRDAISDARRFMPEAAGKRE